MPPDPYYITTPIYYVNDRPHIGHCYTTTVADVAARAQRLLGRDVYFLTGTDEHADKVVAAANERGMTPQQWADQCSGEFRRAFALLDLAPDVFYRTSDPHHKQLAGAYIAALMDRGDVYLGDYVGWYDVSQDEYLTETVAKESGYNSPVTGKPLEKRTEKNYFFRLSKYADALRAHIESSPGFIMPEARRNEVLGRLRAGLQDVPVSRAIRAGDADWGDWGVRMPRDPGHRVYVWIEALCNYLTAIDRDDPGAAARGDLRRYWPASVHVMAKDILWFHAVVWPAMLMALGRALPATVYAHAYYVRDGRKMSKSLGNFVSIEIDLIERTRQVLRRRDAVVPGDAGPARGDRRGLLAGHFVEIYNADLANGIGNCASRVGNMVAKYFDGRLPDPAGRFVFDARSERSRRRVRLAGPVGDGLGRVPGAHRGLRAGRGAAGRRTVRGRCGPVHQRDAPLRTGQGPREGHIHGPRGRPRDTGRGAVLLRRGGADRLADALPGLPGEDGRALADVGLLAAARSRRHQLRARRPARGPVPMGRAARAQARAGDQQGRHPVHAGRSGRRGLIAPPGSR